VALTEADSVAGHYDDDIFVQVVELSGGRQIGWGAATVEALDRRAHDLHRAVEAGASLVREALGGIGAVDGWPEREVSATFAVTLTAESGVVLARASAEASFEVTVTYRADRP
jgi:hypothetical protein